MHKWTHYCERCRTEWHDKGGVDYVLVECPTCTFPKKFVWRLETLENTTEIKPNTFTLRCNNCGEQVVLHDGESTIGTVGVTNIQPDESENGGSFWVRVWCKCGNGVTVE